MNNKIHIYYGNGKGKTTAVTGLAVRGLGAGFQVTIVYFDKGHKDEKEHYSERIILRSIKNCTLIPTGCERILDNGTFRFGNTEEDFNEANRALSIVKQQIQQGNQNILILDEILAAVAYKLIKKTDVMEILDLYDKNRTCELVLSGHKVWQELINRVDLVTQVKKIKHYYDQGVMARLGIDI